MVRMTESALELARKKNHPDAVQEEEGVIEFEEFEEFEDFELPEERHSGIAEMMQKILDACPKRLLDVLLIIVATLLIATLILKKQMLGGIALGVAAIVIAVAMAKIVRDCMRC